MNPYGVGAYHPHPTQLAAWNAANTRARREYEAHPIAACCGHVQRASGRLVPCEEMADGGLCRECAEGVA